MVPHRFCEGRGFAGLEETPGWFGATQVVVAKDKEAVL